MKTAEETLRSRYVNKDVLFDLFETEPIDEMWNGIRDMILLAQEEAYNEALSDANRIVEDSGYDLEYFSESESLKSDILKLKK